MRIHARFRLDQVTRGRGYYKVHPEQPPQQVEAANVQLNAVQGEPFGSATPSGRVEMFIVNPDAAQMFLEAHIGQEFDCFLSPVESERA